MANQIIQRAEFPYTLGNGSTLLTVVLDYSDMFKDGNSYTPVTYLLSPEDFSSYRKVGSLASDKIYVHGGVL